LTGERDAGVIGGGWLVGVEDDEGAEVRLHGLVGAVFLVGALVDGDAPALAAGILAGGGDAAEAVGVIGADVVARGLRVLGGREIRWGGRREPGGWVRRTQPGGEFRWLDFR